MWIWLLNIIAIHPIKECEIFHYQGCNIVSPLLTLSLVIYMGIQSVVKRINNPQVIDG